MKKFLTAQPLWRGDNFIATPLYNASLYKKSDSSFGSKVFSANVTITK